MSQRSVFLRYWLPVIVWMAVIFTASTGSFSHERTSRFIGPFLHWFMPGLSDAAVYRAQYAVRKTSHALEYALLAWLLWRALHRPRPCDSRPWDWRRAGAVLLLCAAYASTDEAHQYFVASRYASAGDVLLDTLGAAGGLGLLWLRHGRRLHLVKTE